MSRDVVASAFRPELPPSGRSFRLQAVASAFRRKSRTAVPAIRNVPAQCAQRRNFRLKAEATEGEGTATPAIMNLHPVINPHAPGRPPTLALLLGLLITLATVVAYSWYVSGQISGLRRLQTDLTDRNRRDSLQLLRIQNDLNQLALAMRDMLDPDEAYPVAAWSSQFERIRTDLDDAMRQQEGVAVARRTPEQSQYLASAVFQFWDAATRIFELAGSGQENEARGQVRLSLQPRQAALSTTVARFLVQNN